MDLSKLSGLCECGQSHELVTRVLDTAPGSLERMPDMLRELGYPDPTAMAVVSDRNTRAAVGARVASLLPGAREIMLTQEHVKADEESIEAVQSRLAGCRLLIAAGSGTIHDIARYVAFEQRIPFVSVPSAASVDGFVANVAAMTLKKMKTTVPSAAPIALFAEPDVLADAPQRLTCAGAGDILGKYISLADWKMAARFTGERYCDKIADLVGEALEKTIQAVDGLAAGDPKAYRTLLDALVLSGLSIQAFGNSRPASGAEHHVSHFWEMGLVKSVRHDALHGEKVGVAAIQMADLYAGLVDRLDNLQNPGEVIDIEEPIRKAYGKLSAGVLETNAENCSLRLVSELVKANIEEIRETYRALPSGETLAACLEKIGGLTHYSQLGVTNRDMDATLRYCPYVRNLPTLLRLCNDYNLR